MNTLMYIWIRRSVSSTELAPFNVCDPFGITLVIHRTAANYTLGDFACYKLESFATMGPESPEFLEARSWVW